MNAQEFFQIGDVIENTWGYDQTNADFYEILKVTAKFVTIRRIETRHIEDAPQAMTGHAVPCLGTYLDAPRRHGVYMYDGQPRANFEFGVGKKWDGKPVSYSSWA